MNRLTLILTKKDGILVPATHNDAVRLHAFTQMLDEGQQVDVYISEFMPETHSLGQLAKVHALIRDIAVETGQDNASVKEAIKQQAGLTKIDETGQAVLRSFAHCSKEELSAAIQVAVNYADMLGITLPDPIAASAA